MRTWTNDQKKAIEIKNHDMLVSAGAGSGKTAVLTERIIEHLTDGDNPSDITRMLIVTFTKAAAGELQERITAALTDALANEPHNKRLMRQLLAVPRAKICTIHSFCLDLLQANFDAAGLSADFRIADETEIRLLSRGLMDELIEDGYGNGIGNAMNAEQFAQFADNFTGTKNDDKLADVFLSLYHRFASMKDGILFIRQFAEELQSDSERDFAESRCGQVIIDMTVTELNQFRQVFADALAAMDGDVKLMKAYTPAFQSDFMLMDNVKVFGSQKNNVGNTAASPYRFSVLRQYINDYTPERLKAYRGDLPHEVELAKNMRDDFKDTVKTLAAKFCSLSDSQIAAMQSETAHNLFCLYELLTLFEKRFSAEKRRRAIVDFDDMEHIAARLLWQDGKTTAIAESVRTLYDEIYIDEYQDVNSLQNLIFEAISNGHNRFMVGDVKQSIYGFRGSEPSIFESYRGEFQKNTVSSDTYTSDNDGGVTVFLSANFRCDLPIIRFANLVCGRLFRNATDTLPYYPEDDLVHAKSSPEQHIPVTVALVAEHTSIAMPKVADTTIPSASENDETVSSAEATYVADEIQRLLDCGVKNDGSPIRPGDVAILMRSAKASAAAFADALSKRKIPYYNNADSDFFENAEVLLALCLLNVIDDPSRDIYLAGVLKSPLYGFTLDELIRIRREKTDGCLYDALCLYTETHGFMKGRVFLTALQKYQRKAENLPVDKLIWELYLNTDLLALVQSDDSGGDMTKRMHRRANLILLYEYARRFEGSSYKGLCNFIRYLNDIIAKDAKLENAKVYSETNDTVKLMTIHQSKGLEFPVVFVCGCQRKANESDLRENIVIEPSLGIALKLSDSTGFARYDTPVRQAIVKRLADRQSEEEMRVLYVALTRARERLYVTGSYTDSQTIGKLLDKTYQSDIGLSRGNVLTNGGYLYWILLALGDYENTEGSSVPSNERPYRIEKIEPSQEKLPDTATADSDSEVTDEESTALVHERFDYVYPNSEAANLPAKLSVSVLAPTFLDEGDATPLNRMTGTETVHTAPTYKIPLFMQDKPEPDATAAERGTATHIFMQFCDFGRFGRAIMPLDSLIDDEIARLTEEKFISPRIASLVNRYALKQFFTSDIFAEIGRAKKVWREYRFNVKLPASDFTENPVRAAALQGETILVQGVIDCFFTNTDGTLTLLDYKTDYIPKTMSRQSAEAMLRTRHGLQLAYYKAACERVSANKVTRTVIYSFGLNDTVDLV